METIFSFPHSDDSCSSDSSVVLVFVILRLDRGIHSNGRKSLPRIPLLPLIPLILGF